MAKHIRDSLGLLPSTTTRSVTLRPSQPACALTEKIGSALTREQLALQVMRLESSWGAPKDRTQEQFVVMCGEWFRALSRFGCKTVEQAFSYAIDHHKFGWTGSGPLSEILAYCTREDHDWREIIALDAPRLAAPAERFEREGRSVEEEIQHRAQQIAEMKRETGFGKVSLEELSKRAERVPAQASLDMTVSYSLRNTCAARRARKVPTCSPTCTRKDCDLKNSDTMQ